MRLFRNKWPLLLAIPPVASVIGGAAMIWVAIATNDGLVEKDYYRKGISINETLAPASIREPAVAPPAQRQ